MSDRNNVWSSNVELGSGNKIGESKEVVGFRLTHLACRLVIVCR